MKYPSRYSTYVGTGGNDTPSGALMEIVGIVVYPCPPVNVIDVTAVPTTVVVVTIVAEVVSVIVGKTVGVPAPLPG